MAWTVTLGGETFNDTDFQPFTYPINFPRIFEAVGVEVSTLREDLDDTYGVSMLTYYSAGDGTDYAPALRRMLAAGETNIIIPGGTYGFRSLDPIGLGYAVHFRDKTGVVIRGAPGGNTNITIGSAANVGSFNFASCTDCAIYDLDIDCARANQTTTDNVHGLRCASLTRCEVRRVGIKNAVGYGLGLQAGTFEYNLFEDIVVSSAGIDGIDVKNNDSGNIGNQFDRLTISDWGRKDPSDAKAAFDSRGGVRVSNSTFYLTTTSGYAGNTPFLRFRPDEQALLTFISASGSVINNSFFTGASSGATGIIQGSTNASTATLIVRGVDGVFTAGEKLNFDNGSSATFSSASYTINTGGRDPSAINCRAYGPSPNYSVGIGFVTSQTGSMFTNCVARNLRDGFKTSPSTAVISIDNCYAQSCNSGFYLEADDTRIVNCTSENSVAEGVYLLGQRNAFFGFRGLNDTVGIRKQGTVLEASFIDMTFTSVSTEYAGSFVTGTFTAINCPGMTNDHELSGHALIGGDGFRVGFYGSNGSTKGTPRGTSFSRSMQTMFSTLSETGLVGNGIVNGVVTGSPETVVSGNVGDIANRTDLGGHLYYKQFGSSGTTGTTSGWVPLRVPPAGTLIAQNYIDPRMTFSRAHTSSAVSMILGPDGAAFRDYSANEPRFQGRNGRFVFEGGRTNIVEDPRFVGAVAGTPGTAPPNWTTFTGSGSGMTREIVGTGFLGGMPYIDVRYYGSPTTTTGVTLASPATTIASSTACALSGRFALVGGSVTNVNFLIRVAAEATTVSFVPTATLTEVRQVRNISGTSASFSLRATYVSTGVATDYTLRIVAPQVEIAQTVSSPIMPASGSTGVSIRSTDSMFASTGAFDIASNGACTVVGSFMLPTTSISASADQVLFEINDGSASNRYLVRNDTATNNVVLYRVTGGAASSISLGAITAGTLFRIAVTIDGAGGASGSLNGGAVQSVSGGPTSGLTIFRVGNNSSGSGPMFGQIQTLRLLNYNVTSTELVALGASIG